MAASSTITRVCGPSSNVVVAQQLEGFGDRVALVSGAFAHGDVDGLAGRRQHQHRAAVAAVRGGARARIEVVLPAPAGADSGWISHGERPMFSTARF